MATREKGRRKAWADVDLNDLPDASEFTIATFFYDPSFRDVTFGIDQSVLRSSLLQMGYPADSPAKRLIADLSECPIRVIRKLPNSLEPPQLAAVLHVLIKIIELFPRGLADKQHVVYTDLLSSDGRSESNSKSQTASTSRDGSSADSVVRPRTVASFVLQVECASDSGRNRMTADDASVQKLCPPSPPNVDVPAVAQPLGDPGEDVPAVAQPLGDVGEAPPGADPEKWALHQRGKCKPCRFHLKPPLGCLYTDCIFCHFHERSGNQKRERERRKKLRAASSIPSDETASVVDTRAQL